MKTVDTILALLSWIVLALVLWAITPLLLKLVALANGVKKGKNTYEVRLPRAVCADHHIDGAQRQLFDRSDAPESLDRDGIERGGWHVLVLARSAQWNSRYQLQRERIGHIYLRIDPSA